MAPDAATPRANAFLPLSAGCPRRIARGLPAEAPLRRAIGRARVVPCTERTTSLPMFTTHVKRQRKNPAEAGLQLLLGYLDSNQEQKNQNLPCCQLHHTPMVRTGIRTD